MTSDEAIDRMVLAFEEQNEPPGPITAKLRQTGEGLASFGRPRGWRSRAVSMASHLRDEYIAIWTVIGIGVGAAIGVTTGDMGVWVAVGAAAGLVSGFRIAKRLEDHLK